jgi:hypothetical protein
MGGRRAGTQPRSTVGCRRSRKQQRPGCHWACVWDVGCGMWDVGAWGMQHGMCGCMHVTASPRVGRYRHTGTQAHRHTALHAAIQIGTKRFSQPGTSAVPLLPIATTGGGGGPRCALLSTRALASPVHARRPARGADVGSANANATHPHPHIHTPTRQPSPALTARHGLTHLTLSAMATAHPLDCWPPVGEKAPRPTTRGARMPLKPP